MLEYKVNVRYLNFYFEDREEALSFAEMAKTHYRDDDDKEVSVEIKILFTELPFAPVPGEVGEGEEE